MEIETWTTKQIAVLCKVKQDTITKNINKAVENGTLPPHVKGKRILLTKDLLLKFLHEYYSPVYYMVKSYHNGNHTQGDNSAMVHLMQLSNGKVQRNTNGTYRIKGFELCKTSDGESIMYKNKVAFITKEQAQAERKRLIERRAKGEFLELAYTTNQVKENKKKAVSKQSFMAYAKDIVNNTGNRSPKTLKDYNALLDNNIEPFFRGLTIADISLELLQKFAQSLKDKRCIDKTKTIMRIVIGNLVLSGRINNIPYQAIKYPTDKGKGSKPKTPLNQTELRLLFKGLKGNKFELPFLLMFYTGARKGEILALTWNDVTINKDNSLTVNIDKSYGLTEIGQGIKDTKNKSSVRTVYVPPNDYVAELFKVAYTNRTCEYIAPNKTHTAPCTGDYFNKVLREVAKAVGITKNVSTHVARHTYISQGLQQDIPITALQEQVGHTDLTMINKVYAKSVIDTATAFQDFSLG